VELVCDADAVILLIQLPSPYQKNSMAMGALVVRRAIVGASWIGHCDSAMERGKDDYFLEMRRYSQRGTHGFEQHEARTSQGLYKGFIKLTTS